MSPVIFTGLLSLTITRCWQWLPPPAIGPATVASLAFILIRQSVVITEPCLADRASEICLSYCQRLRAVRLRRTVGTPVNIRSRDRAGPNAEREERTRCCCLTWTCSGATATGGVTPTTAAAAAAVATAVEARRRTRTRCRRCCASCMRHHHRRRTVHRTEAFAHLLRH